MNRQLEKIQFDFSVTIFSDSMLTFTTADLLEKAKSFLDRFEFDLATQFCKRALDMEPQNAQAMECLGLIDMEKGDLENARSVIFRLRDHF